jgi:hypothetical protein
LRIVGADGVEVRREQDGLADFVSRQQARDDIGTSGQRPFGIRLRVRRARRPVARKSATFFRRQTDDSWRACRAAARFGAKAGFTLGSAMSSARSFSVRVMVRRSRGVL